MDKLDGTLTVRKSISGNIQRATFFDDYLLLENKPSINNVTLEGNKTLDELDIQKKVSYASNIDIDGLFKK